jgi:hypothetical protein
MEIGLRQINQRLLNKKQKSKDEIFFLKPEDTYQELSLVQKGNTLKLKL